MLDEKRIEEARQNVRSYLNEGLLKKSATDKNVLAILQTNAKDSLSVAQLLSEKEYSDLWVIVTSYYSMYYIANAVLLKYGYKVGNKISHKVTSDALIVYIKEKLKGSLLEEYEEIKEDALNIAGIKANTLVESFDSERKKRGIIQYQTKEIEKHSKAKTSLLRAKEFNMEMEKLLIG